MSAKDTSTSSARDLTKEPPRSPNELLGGYKILARMIDKCRATINGTNGEYNFDCPVDKRLITFKEFDSDAFKAFVAEGHSDEEIVQWVNEHGQPKTQEEIDVWSDTADATDYGTREDKKEWFTKECERLGLDPLTTSLFTYLDADDKISFSSSN